VLVLAVAELLVMLGVVLAFLARLIEEEAADEPAAAAESPLRDATPPRPVPQAAPRLGVHGVG
jgi:hypothetical protein